MDEERIREEHKVLEMKRWISTGTSSIRFKVTSKHGVTSRSQHDGEQPSQQQASAKLGAEDSRLVRMSSLLRVWLVSETLGSPANIHNPDVRRILGATQVGELEPTNSERIYAMAQVLSDRNRCGLGGESWHLPPHNTGQITCMLRNLHSHMKSH